MIVLRKQTGITMHGKVTEVLEFDNIFTHLGPYPLIISEMKLFAALSSCPSC